MSIYCVYLTSYTGNLLPPFYIGSSNIIKVKSGYSGSVRSKKYVSVWKSEQKQNPHLFKTIIISKHKTRQDALYKEYSLQKALNVVKNPLYIKQSLANKNGFFGRDVSGKNNPMYGRRWNWTEEQKSKVSYDYKSGKRVASAWALSSKFGKDNPNYGKKWSESSRDKIRGKNNPMYGKGFVGPDNPMYGSHGQLHPKARIYIVLDIKNNILYKVYDRVIFSKDFNICFISLLHAFNKNTKRNKRRIYEIVNILDKDPTASVPYEKYYGS